MSELLRARLAIATAVVILAMAVGLASYVIVISHGSRATLVIFVGYVGLLGLVGSAAAIGIATGVRPWIHRTLTVVFVILSFLGVVLSVVTWLFGVIGLLALGPLTLDLWRDGDEAREARDIVAPQREAAAGDEGGRP